MKLQEAIQIVKLNPWMDILTTLWIKVYDDYDIEKVYWKDIEKLPEWEYFISDLDGTFFRWVLLQEAFTQFSKYVRNLDIRNIDIERYKDFLDDYKYFLELENATYNKQISYTDYLLAWMFLIYKYHDFVVWKDFLAYLRESFYLKQKVNPFKFSFWKMAKILVEWKKFMFVSWASSFVFNIYLDLLKEFVSNHLGKEYVKNIYGFCSYVNLWQREVYNLWQNHNKYEFIKFVKSKWKITKLIWWMWDTTADFWIALHVDEGYDFYFINPEHSVIDEFLSNKDKYKNIHFINERKNLIFEYNPENINVLD